MSNNHSPTLQNKTKTNIILKKKNKFTNMTSKDWQEANEQSKKIRGISGLTYKDIFNNH